MLVLFHFVQQFSFYSLYYLLLHSFTGFVCPSIDFFYSFMSFHVLQVPVCKNERTMKLSSQAFVSNRYKNVCWNALGYYHFKEYYCSRMTRTTSMCYTHQIKTSEENKNQQKKKTFSFDFSLAMMVKRKNSIVCGQQIRESFEKATQIDSI